MQVDALLLGGDADAAERARQLAAAGLDGVFSFEGPFDPFVPLTLAAGATDLAISTTVALAFVRSPMSFAYLAWDLQRLSGGRFVLGLGTQVRANVEDRYGAEFSRPVARMREVVAAIQAIFDRWQHGTPLDVRGEFTRHTLMQPMFDPGPLDCGPPPVFVGALGPRMTEMAARCADGVVVHPVMTPRYLEEVTRPALAAGLAASGRGSGELGVIADVIVGAGRDEAEMAAAVEGVRALLGFYLSTPAYSPVLAPYGWEDAHHELRRMSRAGRWDDMSAVVDDTMLRTLAVVGAPEEVGPAVAARLAGLDPDRVGFYLPYAATDDLVADVAASFRAG